MILLLLSRRLLPSETAPKDRTWAKASASRPFQPQKDIAVVAPKMNQCCSETWATTQHTCWTQKQINGIEKHKILQLDDNERCQLLEALTETISLQSSFCISAPKLDHWMTMGSHDCNYQLSWWFLWISANYPPWRFYVFDSRAQARKRAWARGSHRQKTSCHGVGCESTFFWAREPQNAYTLLTNLLGYRCKYASVF